MFSNIRCLSLYTRLKTTLKCMITQKRSVYQYRNNRSCLLTTLIRSNKVVSVRFFNSESDESDDGVLRDRDHEQFVQTFFQVPGAGHRLFLIQPNIQSGPGRKWNTTINLQMDEAVTLAETIPNWRVMGKMFLGTKSIEKKQVFGKGNIDKLKEMVCNKTHLSAVFINVDQLSDVQHEELESILGLTVFDRYAVVLQIFREHAKTKVSKLQVALAEIPYLRSRLKRINEGGHGKLAGGTRYIGGSGETFYELRKRLLAFLKHIQVPLHFTPERENNQEVREEREAKIKQTLKKIEGHRKVIRKQRGKKELPIIAVVGYTNSGKTSLIKALTGEKDMKPLNRLFATLDVTAHGGYLLNRVPVIYVDTVGFISDIPTQLIQSFNATLEDALNADLIIHVRDVSHPDTNAQHDCVMETLKGLNIPENVYDNVIEVGNKIDLIPDFELGGDDKFIPVSATLGSGLEDVMLCVEDLLMEVTDRGMKVFRVRNGGEEMSWLYREGAIQSAIPDEEDCEFMIMRVILVESAAAKFRHRFGNLDYDPLKKRI